MELPKKVNMVLDKSHDISPLKLPNSPPFMLDVQHIIGLEQHIELSDPLPPTLDEENKDNPNLLGYV
jgi:hypothetical protein